jgi:hypothetical protein
MRSWQMGPGIFVALAFLIAIAGTIISALNVRER